MKQDKYVHQANNIQLTISNQGAYLFPKRVYRHPNTVTSCIPTWPNAPVAPGQCFMMENKKALFSDRIWIKMQFIFTFCLYLCKGHVHCAKEKLNVDSAVIRHSSGRCIWGKLQTLLVLEANIGDMPILCQLLK